MDRYWLSLHRAFILVAVTASALLFVHYLAPADSDFCGGASGCEAVRRSGFSYFGTPYLNTPLFGMLAFAALFALGWGQPQGRRLLVLRAAGGLAGVCGLGLIVVQAVMVKAFCWLCLIVDVAAVGAAFSAAALVGKREQRPMLRPAAWAGLFACAAGLPVVWHLVKPLPPVPSQVSELYVSGKINVVEFADFQCPYCRRLHSTLKAVVAEYGDQVAFTRLHKPIEHHVMARGAAYAAVCAEAQGKGEPMADLLFEGELGDDHYLAYAQQLELDRSAFEACLNSPETAARVDADIERFETAGLRGLPTTFIGEQKLTGAKPMPVFRDALARAAAGEEDFAVSGPIYLALSILLAGGIAAFGRQRDEAQSNAPTAG